MKSDTIKKCIISRYDHTITEPPFLTIKIDEMDVNQPQVDYLGEKFADRLVDACLMKGYVFKFYTTSYEEGFDYEVVVF